MNNDEFHKRLNELKDIWLKEFNLKDLDSFYVPNIPQEVKDYIGGSDMKITQGNFLKILLKNREYIIPFIKPTIENPQLVLDNGEGILFIKTILEDEKNLHFMSISKKYDGEWIFSSHTRREFENIKNELRRSKIIYDNGFERSEVAGASDILESGGEVSKPSDLQIKYTANQDFGTNPNTIIPQSPNNDEETYMIPNQNTSNTHFITQDSTSNLSLEEQISLAKENQKTLNAMPKASDIDKDNTQESTQTQDTTQRVETQSQNSTLRRKL